MREQMDKFKNFEQFLNENASPKFGGLFYGYHCSDNSDMEDNNNDGLPIGDDDYFQWHESILERLANEGSKKADEYLSVYDENDIGYGQPFTIEVGNFINGMGIKGVFISEDEPNYRWGEYCYEVYFVSKEEFEPIQDHNALEDGDENSYLYIYQNNDVYYKKKRIDENENKKQVINNISWDDINISLSYTGVNGDTYNVGLPSNDYSRNGIDLKIQLLGGIFNQTHISLPKKWQGFGLVTKIYKAAAYSLGHIVSAKGRRHNPLMDKIWSKLMADQDVQCYDNEIMTICFGKTINTKEKEILLNKFNSIT